MRTAMDSCSFTCLGHRASIRAESTATTRFPAPGISLPALIVGQSPSWDEHAILGRSSRAGGIRWRTPTLHAGSPGSGNATRRTTSWYLQNVWHSERWLLMALEQVDAYLEKHRDHFEAQLQDLIRIPSVSAQPDHDPDTQQAATFVRDDLAAIGLKAELISTQRHPLVYAEWLPSRLSHGSLRRSSRQSATATSMLEGPRTTRARCSLT